MPDDQTRADCAAAFAAWEAYRPQAKASYAAMSPVVAAALAAGQETILNNPISMLTFAEGYLEGVAAGLPPARADADERQRALLERWLTNHLPCVYGEAGCDLCLETRAALEGA